MAREASRTSETTDETATRSSVSSSYLPLDGEACCCCSSGPGTFYVSALCFENLHLPLQIIGFSR